MSLFDISKSGSRRLNPRTNGNDQVADRPAHDTVGHTYLSEGQISGSDTTFKRLQSRLSIPTALVITPSYSIQDAIDEVAGSGGGVVFLTNGTYTMSTSITIPSGVTLQGATSDGVIIDFQNTSNNISAQAASIETAGTVSATNKSATITGSGTNWTGALVGNSILIQGVWYGITAVASTTSLTMDGPFESLGVAGASYVIADPVGNVSVQSLTVQASQSINGAILFKNINGLNIFDVNAYDSTIGISYVNASDVTVVAMFLYGCTTGMNISQGGIWSLKNWATISCGTGARIDGMVSASISDFTNSQHTGNGFTITSCKHVGIYDGLVVSNGGKGIEITNSSDTQMFSLTVHSNTSDGIKLTSDANRSSMFGGILFQNNGGYGLNIAAASCNNNTVAGCSFTGNTSGTVNNAGTLTINANNQT